MCGKQTICNECRDRDQGKSQGVEDTRDKIRMLEISEAIQDLDSKLTDLELALKLEEPRG